MTTLRALLVLLLLAGDATAADRLVYALRHQNPGQRHPSVVWTRIVAIDVETGERRQLFSDEGSPLLLLHRHGMPSYPGEVIAAASGRLFAHGLVGRADRPRAWSSAAAVYELSTDGSNTFRKVLDVRGEDALTELRLNASGSRVAYLNHEGKARRLTGFVHDVGTGALVGAIDVHGLCPLCYPRSVGWMADGRRLFFVFEPGPHGTYSRKEYREVAKKVGTYVVNEDGRNAARMAVAELNRRLPRNFQLGPEGPVLFAERPDGRHLFLAGGPLEGGGVSTVVAIVDPGKGLDKRVAIGQESGAQFVKVSPSGRWLAITYANGTRDQQDLKIKDLDSGAERVVASFPLEPPHRREDFVGLVGWLMAP